MSFILTGLICLGAGLAIASEADISAWLGALSTDHPAFADRVLAVATRELGTAYADGPLGEGPDGTHDKDPKIDLSKVDCVTFVEQTVALAAAANYADAYATLQEIRYKNGVETFEGRNHFFVSDWIRDNPWCREVTSELGLKAETVTRTISRKDFFKLVKAPEFGQDELDETVTLAYIPSNKAAAVEAKLPDAALITFVGKVEWLFALHCGLFLRDSAGNGFLYHASSKSGAVVKMPLADYLSEQSTRYLGFTVHAVTEPQF